MAAAPPAAPVEEDSTYTLASLGTKKIHEIKDILRVMGKRVTGNKEDLIAVRSATNTTCTTATWRWRRAFDSHSFCHPLPGPQYPLWGMNVLHKHHSISYKNTNNAFLA